MNSVRRKHSTKTLILIVVGIGLLGTILTLTSKASIFNKSAGDLNNTGKVDILDLSYLLSHYSSTDITADINDDGYVNIFDLSILLKNFGQTITPPVDPEPATCSSSADLLFCDGFETYSKEIIPAGELKDTQFKANWMLNQSCPDRVSIADDPIRAGKKSLKLTVKNTDVNANCPKSPNQNPRAQMVTNSEKVKFEYGKEYYIKFGTYLPADFPRNIALNPDGTRQGYFQIGQIWGGPTTCSPPIGIFLQGTRLRLNSETGSPGACKVLGDRWLAKKDVQYNKWEYITLHVKMSDDKNVGFVELWYNDEKQTFADGTTKYKMATMIDGVNWKPTGATNNLYMNSYRGANTGGADGFLTIYHDDVKIGKTYDSVQ